MNQKILLIDGHPVYVNKMVGFLQGLTFKDIRIAKTGQQGIDEFAAYHPNLVILSSMLQDMDSLQVCKEINEINLSYTFIDTIGTRIIVQTGLFTENETINQFKANGADAVLMRKEKDLRPLQNTIEELLFSNV